MLYLGLTLLGFNFAVGSIFFSTLNSDPINLPTWLRGGPSRTFFVMVGPISIIGLIYYSLNAFGFLQGLGAMGFIYVLMSVLGRPLKILQRLILYTIISPILLVVGVLLIELS